MPKKGSDPHLQDQDLYEELRKQGDSKENAARISNAAASEGRAALCMQVTVERPTVFRMPTAG